MSRVRLSYSPHCILRDGAVVACWAHNPEVVGSTPTPATNNGKVAVII